ATRGGKIGARGQHGAVDAFGSRRQGRRAGCRDARGARLKLEARLRERRDAGRKLLVPYVTGGLGAAWCDVVRACAAGGADAIEVGIPFSDPIMDGKTIQEASQRALDLGATPMSVLAGIASLDIDVPVSVMT